MCKTFFDLGKTEMSAKPAPKRKNNEKRKEKSRVAAKDRRNREQELFNELTEAVPAPKELMDALDKASVMRLAISYLKVRDLVNRMLPSNDESCDPKAAHLSYLEALDGFVMVLSTAGDIVYLSENIADFLGVGQIELMGQSIFEMSHPCDHDDLMEILRSRKSPDATPASFLARLKCTLTAKGRSVHLKSANYKVIKFTGHMMTSEKDASPTEVESSCESSDGSSKPKEPTEESWLVAVGRPIPQPDTLEKPLDSNVFITKHSLDMKFTYADEMAKSLGYEPDELVGKSLYDYHYTADLPALQGNFKSLFSKGQCETGRFRFLAKYGGYAWVQTQATLIRDKHQKPLSVVCLNYVVTGIECKDDVFSTCQLANADIKTKSKIKPRNLAELPDGAFVSIVPPIKREPEEARPRPATSQIFAQRTKDMNKGFLTISQEDPGLTLLKDEPEDLTHLAPTAGDACIPLEDNPFDVFDGWFPSDNYCELLGDDLAGTSPDSFGPSESPALSSPRGSEASCDRSLPAEISLDGGFDSGLECGTPGHKSDNELDSYISPASLGKMWGALSDEVNLARPKPVQIAPVIAETKPMYSNTGEHHPHSMERSKRYRETESRTSSFVGDVPKRARRGISPPPDPVPKSSVLMNLLDHVALNGGRQIKLIQDVRYIQPNSGPPIHPVDVPLSVHIPYSGAITPTASPGRFISPYSSPTEGKYTRIVPKAVLQGSSDPILTRVKMETNQSILDLEAYSPWIDDEMLTI